MYLYIDPVQFVSMWDYYHYVAIYRSSIVCQHVYVGLLYVNDIIHYVAIYRSSIVCQHVGLLYVNDIIMQLYIDLVQFVDYYIMLMTSLCSYRQIKYSLLACGTIMLMTSLCSYSYHISFIQVMSLIAQSSSQSTKSICEEVLCLCDYSRDLQGTLSRTPHRPVCTERGWCITHQQNISPAIGGVLIKIPTLFQSTSRPTDIKGF